MSVTPAMVVFVVGLIPLISVMGWHVRHPGLWDKLWLIMQANPVYIIMSLFFVIVAPVIVWRIWPKKILWWEMLGTMAYMIPTAILVPSIFFYYTTDVHDQENWNSRTSMAEYWEEWTEHVEQECCSTDSDGNETCTDCSYDLYHPPEWYGHTAAPGDPAFRLAQAQYGNYVQRWGNEQFDDIFRMNQISFGDGNRYYVDYPNNPEVIVPTAQKHEYVNFPKGSKQTILKRGCKSSAEKHAALMRPYPEVTGGPFGPIEINRVVDANVNAPDKWKKTVDRRLDVILAELGPAREVDVIVYLAGTSDPKFVLGLEEHWVGGKKNNVIVVIGAPEWPKIEWVGIFDWCENSQFRTELHDNIEDLETLKGNARAFVDLIEQQIRKPPEHGGWDRFEMSKLDFMANDIKLPWWAYVLIFLIYSFVFAMVTICCHINDFQKEMRSRYGRYGSSW